MTETFTPTPEQVTLIEHVNLAVNDDPRWIGQENFCVPAMAEKLQRLQALGIPLAAMAPVTVDAGPRYGDEAHSLLRVTGALPSGAPWVVFLDINQPDLLSASDLAELGYTILET